MPESGKPTVALVKEEFDILSAIRRHAPRYRIHPRQAEIYGIWMICYRRYCEAADIPWLWMTSVSKFMDFLDDRSEVSPSERNRALDGIMLYLTDIRPDEEKEEAESRERSQPRSTRSLFAQLLLRCDVQITEAIHLRASDVRLGDSRITLRGDYGERSVEIPPRLRSSLKEHVSRIRRQSGDGNPPLFAHRGFFDDALTDGANWDGAPEDDTDVARTTKLATRVMQTFDS